jgi:hypothetical protein
MTETEAVFYELELDAAWAASQQMKAENEQWRKVAQTEKQYRLEYATRSDGYAHIAAVIQHLRSYDITRDEALEQITELVNKTNDKLKAGRIDG